MPATVASVDERHGAVARNERAQQLERPDLDANAGRREDDVVEVAGDEVGRRLVERPPALVQLGESAFVLRERARSAAGPLPGGVERNIEPDRRGARAKRLARPAGLDRAAAEGEDARVR